MKLTIAAFKKAAKRLSNKHSIPLAQTQESLADAFGFTNLDAALKALDPPHGHTPSGAAPAQGIVWNGLTIDEAARKIVEAGYLGYASEWKVKTHQVLLAVLRDLVTVEGMQTLETEDIEKAILLTWIESRYVALYNSFGDDFPRASIGIKNYLDNLPAYRVRKLLAKGVDGSWNPQDGLATEQHNFRVYNIKFGLFERESALNRPQV